MVMAGFTDHFEQMTIIKVYFIVEVLAVDYNFFWHDICIHRRQLESVWAILYNGCFVVYLMNVLDFFYLIHFFLESYVGQHRPFYLFFFLIEMIW